jgi:IMP dehydrogenase
VLDRAGALIGAGVDVQVLDSAHVHSENIMKCVEKVKAKYPDIQLVAGNVATRRQRRPSSAGARTA